MRDFASITDEEVKKVYEQTPEVNQYHTWEAVKNCEPMYLALKNKIIAHEQESNMKLPENVRPIFAGVDLATNKSITALANVDVQPAGRIERLPEEKKEMRRSTITLNEKQINQMRSAIRLGKNCLMTYLGDDVKEEAIRELKQAQETFNSFFK